MDNLLKYEEFINEEINLRKAAVGTMLGASLLMGGGCVSDRAELDDIEAVGGENFKQYDLYKAGENFDLTIKDDIIVSQHSYTEGSGDDQTTTSRTNLILPNENVREIWYDSKFLKGTFASRTQFAGSKKLNIGDLKLQEETDSYKIYTSPKWFSTFDYIIVNKGHKQGEEFQLSDGKIQVTYVCYRIDKDIYIIAMKGLGGGNFGGGGSGGNF